MRIPVVALPLLVLSTPAAAAVSVTPGQVYEGGTRVGIPSLGLSFRLPAMFRGGLTQQGVFIMGSEAGTGVILGVSDENVTAESLVRQLSQPLPLDANTILLPAGAAKLAGRTVTNRYAATVNGRKMTGWAKAKLLDDGVAIAFVSLSSDKRAAKDRLDDVFESMVQLPRAEADHEAWSVRLRGYTLTYMKTANGLSTKKEIQLCQNGQFTYSGSDSYLSGGFSAAGRRGSGGAWSIRGDTLVLTYSDGRVDRRALSANGGRTFLDGTRWFVQPGAYCY